MLLWGGSNYGHILTNKGPHAHRNPPPHTPLLFHASFLSVSTPKIENVIHCSLTFLRCGGCISYLLPVIFPMLIHYTVSMSDIVPLGQEVF